MQAVDRVSFEVRSGEIVGIAGVEGNGQTELMEALAGLVEHHRVSGDVVFEGKIITKLDGAPAQRTRNRACSRRSASSRPPAGFSPCRELDSRRSLSQAAVARAGGILLDEAGIRSTRRSDHQGFRCSAGKCRIARSRAFRRKSAEADHRTRIRAAAEAAAGVAADARRRHRRDRIHSSQAGGACAMRVAQCCWCPRSSRKSQPWQIV